MVSIIIKDAGRNVKPASVNFVGFFTNLIGFKTTSNLVIGIILSLLLLITLFLTVIINDQKNKIKLLIQEISMLKKEGSKNEKD